MSLIISGGAYVFPCSAAAGMVDSELSLLILSNQFTNYIIHLNDTTQLQVRQHSRDTDM